MNNSKKLINMEKDELPLLAPVGMVPTTNLTEIQDLFCLTNVLVTYFLNDQAIKFKFFMSIRLWIRSPSEVKILHHYFYHDNIIDFDGSHMNISSWPPRSASKVKRLYHGNSHNDNIGFDRSQLDISSWPLRLASEVQTPHFHIHLDNIICFNRSHLDFIMTSEVSLWGQPPGYEDPTMTFSIMILVILIGHTWIFHCDLWGQPPRSISQVRRPHHDIFHDDIIGFDVSHLKDDELSQLLPGVPCDVLHNVHGKHGNVQVVFGRLSTVKNWYHNWYHITGRSIGGWNRAAPPGRWGCPWWCPWQ